MERLRTMMKVINKIAEFKNHKDDYFKMLRSTYEALVGFYSSLKELSHFTYCYNHYMSHCYAEESEFDTVRVCVYLYAFYRYRSFQKSPGGF